MITGEGSPIADKEEKNAIAEKQMNDAADVLDEVIERDRNDFEAELSQLQLSAKLEREMKRRQRDEQLVDGAFEFQCFNCSDFICMSTDIRKVQGAHHVCVDSDVSERVTLRRFLIPSFVDGDMKSGGDVFCNNCRSRLGGVCDYKGIQFPMITIDLFLLMDMHGKLSHKRRWKNAPCKIQEIDLDDLLQFSNQQSNHDY